MTTPRTAHPSSPSGIPTRTADPDPTLLHLVDGREKYSVPVPGGGGRKFFRTYDMDADGGLALWLRLAQPGFPGYPFNRVRAGLVARRDAVLTGGSPDLARFGQLVLGLARGDRWSEALSTALLGDWADPLHDGTGLGLPALDRLRLETRTIHAQLGELWEKRTYGNKRVTSLDAPVGNGATLRDLLADRHLPDDPLLDQVPGDRRLAALLTRLTPAERDVVLALGHPGVATWADAAEYTGSAQPGQDGTRVRRKVGRAVRELRRRDGQRTDDPTGLWTPARNGGAL
ncbi:hypothetical protein BOQ63_001500 (plasmid) [Streptomyces viridifaciens]|nr:hypothetical protein BOQ63_001500 [Streptomyces viridifaciens]